MVDDLLTVCFDFLEDLGINICFIILLLRINKYAMMISVVDFVDVVNKKCDKPWSVQS